MFVPADLMLNATRSLATSALPNAPVEPDLPPRPSRIRTVLRALLHRGNGQRGDRDQAHRPGDTVVHRAHDADPAIQQDTGQIPGASIDMDCEQQRRNTHQETSQQYRPPAELIVPGQDSTSTSAAAGSSASPAPTGKYLTVTRTAQPSAESSARDEIHRIQRTPRRV